MKRIKRILVVCILLAFVACSFAASTGPFYSSTGKVKTVSGIETVNLK